MDTSLFAEWGWLQFMAVLLAAAGLIVSLWLGRNDAWMIAEGQTRVGEMPTWLSGIGIAWCTVRLLVPLPFRQLLVAALIVPGVDLAIFLATTAVLIRSLSECFAADWDWRVGLRQYRHFLLPVLYAGFVYGDTSAYPKEVWIIAAVEAALALPFLIRLGCSTSPRRGT